MAHIELKQVCKKYENGFEAVKDFQLEIADGEFVIFVGPSGCGKSTTLRMIAGLEEISSGELLIDGINMNEVPSSERDIAMVFQNYALYPHMTVRKNIAYSLKIHHEKKEVIEQKVLSAAKILDLEQLLDRKPAMLSGGQKQRVAMGRAIVRDPKVFLMDEPLSNLDAKLRGQMRVEIARLYRQLKSTFIYVTHDQTEAMTLGTKIVVMKDGIIQQVDTPKRLFRYPRNQFVAGFIGSPPMNFMEAHVKTDNTDVFLELADKRIELPKYKIDALIQGNYVGKKVVIGIRPNHIKRIEGSEEKIHLKGTVDVYEMLGTDANLYLHTDPFNEKIVANIKADDMVSAGDEMNFALETDEIHIFDLSSGETITN